MSVRPSCFCRDAAWRRSAVVEQHLANNPEDQTIWGLKRVLYHELHEEEYLAEAETWPTEPPAEPQPPRFDYAFVQQLGLALINNDERWGTRRRIPAHRRPWHAAVRPQHVCHDRPGAATHREFGRGLAQLRVGQTCRQERRPLPTCPPEEAEVYYGTVKYLGDAAQARGDLDTAIENYRIYVESSSSGIETLRNLAGLCERKGDVLSALRFNDMALVYNAKDKDLAGTQGPLLLLAHAGCAARLGWKMSAPVLILITASARPSRFWTIPNSASWSGST